jgi:hypothetical protein
MASILSLGKLGSLRAANCAAYRGHYVPHDFRGAFQNPDHANLAPDTFDGFILAIAGAAKQLQCAVSDATHHLGSCELGHRSDACTVLRLPIVSPRCLVTDEPRRVQVGSHVSEHPLDTLVIGKRPAELMPLSRVGSSQIKEVLGSPHAIGRPIDAACIKALHGDGKAITLLPEAIFDRDSQVLEKEL